MIYGRYTVAKANIGHAPIDKERRSGYRKRLGTVVVLTVNVAGWLLEQA